VRRAALEAALEAPSPLDRDALAEAARLDPDAQCRSLAARTLGTIGGEAGVRALMDLWEHGDADDRGVPAVTSVDRQNDEKPGSAPLDSVKRADHEQKNRPAEITNSVGMKLLLIPDDRFRMGSPMTEEDRNDDEAQADVNLTQGFYLGSTEVTQAQWQTVMGTSPLERRRISARRRRLSCDIRELGRCKGILQNTG
jgi:formylglycine-generating enzyme required for sulfatase activity